MDEQWVGTYWVNSLASCIQSRDTPLFTRGLLLNMLECKTARTILREDILWRGKSFKQFLGNSHRLNCWGSKTLGHSFGFLLTFYLGRDLKARLSHMTRIWMILALKGNRRQPRCALPLLSEQHLSRVKRWRSKTLSNFGALGGNIT